MHQNHTQHFNLKIKVMKPKFIFIEYLNRDKNFTLDKVYFENYKDAVQWGKDNFENFNFDMIKYEK